MNSNKCDCSYFLNPDCWYILAHGDKPRDEGSSHWTRGWNGVPKWCVQCPVLPQKKKNYTGTTKALVIGQDDTCMRNQWAKPCSVDESFRNNALHLHRWLKATLPCRLVVERNPKLDRIISVSPQTNPFQSSVTRSVELDHYFEWGAQLKSKKQNE
jgi:hypothetical protein